MSAAALTMTHASDETLHASVLEPLPHVERSLRAEVESMGLPENLREAVLYSVTGPGKRLRPLLVWHACAAAGGMPEEAMPAAVAIELIHCFSLVHDDLPGLDNDDLRRGRPTLHKHAGEAMAILAGDEMLTLAFRVLAERVAPAALIAKLVGELSRATSDMIVGQVYDTLGGMPDKATPAHRLELVHRNKTGALISCACRMGGLVALRGGDGPVLRSLTAYADAIGLMFQIVDDLLDVTQTTEHLGKKANKDADAGKLTYPGVFGIEPSRRKVQELHTAALEALQNLPGSEPLAALASYMAVRTR